MISINLGEGTLHFYKPLVSNVLDSAALVSYSSINRIFKGTWYVGHVFLVIVGYTIFIVYSIYILIILSIQ